MTVEQASLTGYSINPHQWWFSDQLVRLNSTQFDTVKYRETLKLENKSEAHSQSICVSQFNRHIHRTWFPWFPFGWCHSICAIPAIIMSHPSVSSLLWYWPTSSSVIRPYPAIYPFHHIVMRNKRNCLAIFHHTLILPTLVYIGLLRS